MFNVDRSGDFGSSMQGPAEPSGLARLPHWFNAPGYKGQLGEIGSCDGSLKGSYLMPISGALSRAITLQSWVCQ